MDKNTNDKLDLAKLRAHLREKPRTKAGQVRQAWPEIKQLLASGHSLKDICQWLNEIGLEIGYARLSDYVCQLRRREAPLPMLSETETETEPVMPERNINLIQPLAHILEREKSRAGFSYNAEPDPKKLEPHPRDGSNQTLDIPGAGYHCGFLVSRLIVRLE